LYDPARAITQLGRCKLGSIAPIESTGGVWQGSRQGGLEVRFTDLLQFQTGIKQTEARKKERDEEFVLIFDSS